MGVPTVVTRRGIVAAALGSLFAPAVGEATVTTTPWLDRATARLRHERDYLRATNWFAGLNTSYPVALAVQTYVLGHVSAPAYGWDQLHGVPVRQTPETILATESGICGGAQIVFCELAHRLGLVVRPVYMFYGDQETHATAEVQWGPSWHWLDPTWGVLYRDPAGRHDDVLGLLDVLELGPDRVLLRIMAEHQLWNQASRSDGIEPDNFLDATPMRVESPRGVTVWSRP